MFWYYAVCLHERKVLIRSSAVFILEGVARALGVGRTVVILEGAASGLGVGETVVILEGAASGLGVGETVVILEGAASALGVGETVVILEGVTSALEVGGRLDDGCLGLRCLNLVGVFGDVLAGFGTRLSSLSSTRVHEVLAVHNFANGLLGGTHGAVVGVGDFVSHY
ncbi:MAG: hypothetical protein BYD32DRAFT_417416 [Podila humilis]|nr:MAG: hypothetical protein BYD32DRAFT_417416 [Podila humilis]